MLAPISLDLIKRILLSLIAALYIIVGIIAGAPYSPLVEAWTGFFKPVFNYFGLYNNFGVFAPDPAKYNQEFYAVIRFQDGTTNTWRFPSLLDYKNSDVMKQLKLPWVEWEYYFVWDPQNVVLLPDAAKYIAYVHRDSKNQPTQIEIFRDFQYIDLPGKKEKDAGIAKSELLLKYDVQIEDLK